MLSPTPTPARRVLSALSTNTLLPTPPSTGKQLSRSTFLTPLKPLTPVSLKRKAPTTFEIYEDQENDTPSYDAKRRRMDAGEIKPSMLGMSSPCVQRAQRVKIEREEVEVFELDGEEEEVASSPVRARSTRPSAARSAGAQTEDEMDDEEEDATVLRPASYQDEEEVNGDETEDELEPVKQLPPSSPLPLPKRSSRAATPVLLPSSSPPRVARVEASPELASTIKLRLQMALFKVLTNQTRVPVSRLSDPSREQALAFSRRREGKVEPMAVAPSGLESRYTLGREMSGMEGLAAAAAGREAV